jgi:glycosyltransferase involved in cell wall biosynthesis
MSGGVDAERFTPSPRLAGAVDGAGTVVTIGTVGRLDPVKNQALLLSVFASLRPRFPGLPLTIVGDGPERATLEAMATGLPVVAGRVGGNPELVVGGVTGRLYEPADPSGLEQTLSPYLTDLPLRQAHGAAGRARVVQNFSLDAMVERYLGLYDELMAED